MATVKLNKNSCARSSVSNSFHFQIMEAGIWTIRCFSRSTVDFKQPQTTVQELVTMLSIFIMLYLRCEQKLLHPINGMTLLCLSSFVCFSTGRDRGREDTGKKSLQMKHLSSKGVFVSSCQNPSVL